MMLLEPYLNFNGNTEQAFLFYRSVFGGNFTALMRFADMPGSEKMPEEDRQRIMHISLPIGDHVTLKATDIIDSLNQQLQVGDNFHLAITVDNEADIHRLFNGISAGGTVIMPLGKESWGELFGMCKDKFGIQWMFNYVKPAK